MLFRSQNLVGALIEDFESSGPNLLNAIQNGLKEKNIEEVQQAGHALKSTSAALGAMYLSEIAGKLEECTSLEKAAWLATSLEPEFKKCLEELVSHFMQDKKAA